MEARGAQLLKADLLAEVDELKGDIVACAQAIQFSVSAGTIFSFPEAVVLRRFGGQLSKRTLVQSMLDLIPQLDGVVAQTNAFGWTPRNKAILADWINEFDQIFQIVCVKGGLL